MSYYNDFNTTKIIDRATERNKTQKYARIFFKVPMRTIHYYENKLKYGSGKPRIVWNLKESYEDLVKSPTYTIENDAYSKQWLLPDDKIAMFTDDEKNFHKFCEDNHLEFDIFPTGSYYKNKEEYFRHNYHKIRDRGEVVMLNFFNALTSEYDDVLFSANEIYNGWDSNLENLQFEFFLYIPEWGEKTPTEIKSLLNAEINKYNLLQVLEDLYGYTLSEIEITVKNAAIRKTTVAKCDLSKPLKDQYGVDIEKDDVIVYPHGGDHNFYGCKFDTVVEWGDSMVVLKSGTKRRHDKMVVVSSNNKNKKLGWELDNGKEDD